MGGYLGDNSMISVIISTYNRPEKLKKAIKSVIAQTYKDWELIIVHDSKDELPTVSALDDRIREYWIDHFGSDTKPKNYGIKQAKGEYIAFLDDDNTWRPDHLQVLMKAMERNPKVDIVYGDRWVTDLDKKFPPRLGMMSDFSIQLLLQRNFIDTSDVLMKLEALFDVGGFDERYKKYIDWNLWVRLAKAGKLFLHVPVIITDYYLHKSQKSAVGWSYTENEKKVITRWEKSSNYPDWRAFTDADVERGLFSDFGQYDLEIKLPYLGEVREPKVAIFSLTYDRLEFTKKCFESLYKTAGYPFDHFVVDNGSTDGTQDWLMDEYDSKHVRTFKVNKGISIASNQAIEDIKFQGDYDIIVKVDNDALFITPDWLKTMVKIWKSNHRLVMSPYVQGLRDNPGGAPRIGWGWIAGEYLGMTKHIGGLVHFVDADAYKEWRWDEKDFLHGMQDLEFSQYLMLNGYQMGYLENYFVEHCEGTVGQEKKFPSYFERRKKDKTTRYEKNV